MPRGARALSDELQGVRRGVNTQCVVTMQANDTKLHTCSSSASPHASHPSASGIHSARSEASGAGERPATAAEAAAQKTAAEAACKAPNPDPNL